LSQNLKTKEDKENKVDSLRVRIPLPAPETFEKSFIKIPSNCSIVSPYYGKFAYSKTIDFTVIQDFKVLCAIDRQLNKGTVGHFIFFICCYIFTGEITLPRGPDERVVKGVGEG
jgi:hypothetical protein